MTLTGRCAAPPDLFAIVKTTEKLERAYVRDAISAKDYEPLCEKLIAQFRTLWETLRDTVQPRYTAPLSLFLTHAQAARPSARSGLRRVLMSW